MMRLILARTADEARRVMRLGDKYLGILPDDLFGHCDCDLMEIGYYWARPDFKAGEIYYYCKSHNITMSRKFESEVKQ